MRTVLRPVADSRDGEEAWRETISRMYGGLDVRLHDGPHEQDQLVVGEVGPLQVLDSRTGPGETTKRRHLGDDERFALYLQGDGATVAEQGGRSDRYHDGDLALVDLARPFRCRYTARRIVMVSFPYDVSPLPQDDAVRLLGGRIPGRDGAADLLTELLRRLPDHLDETDPQAAARVASAVLDLMHAVLASRVGKESTVDTRARRRVLLLQCRAFIEQHLHDPALSPAMVAAAHHVSLRQLHLVFEEGGETVAGRIRRRRLERCRADLLDPALAGRPAAAVGARWGFPDPANFSRAFKREYGVPPATYRAELGRLAG